MLRSPLVRRRLRFVLVLFCACAGGVASGAPTAAAESPPPTASSAVSPPEAIAALRDIVARQKAAIAESKTKTDASELEDLRPRLQRVTDDYESLVTKYPAFAAGWAAYGLFLCDPLVEDRNAALPLLLKANGLDREIPVVKNQIGVILAEQGRPIEAFNYFLAASDLAPNEPLYHFQIGLVLAEGRADFLKSHAWTRAALDKSMLRAFTRAAALAPERTDFAYRAAEAYYDLAEPRWEEAYRVWTALEERLEGRLETQVVRLHRARVLWKQGLAADARELAATVDASELAGQKAKLLAEFASDEAAENAAKRAPGSVAPPDSPASSTKAPPTPAPGATVAFPSPATAPAAAGK